MITNREIIEREFAVRIKDEPPKMSRKIDKKEVHTHLVRRSIEDRLNDIQLGGDLDYLNINDEKGN